jgi:hypothetical protein
MFYWLNSFTQCLSLFFHQGMGSNPTSCTGSTGWPDTVSKLIWRACAIVVARVHLAHVERCYVDLIKWIDGLTDWPDTVRRPVWRVYAIVVARVHLARVRRRLASIDV